METQEAFLPIDKGRDGATWWVGSWQCRNWRGWLQSREDGRGPWAFTIYGFGEDDASVYALDENGEECLLRAPIDRNDRLTIEGRKFGRTHWRH